MKYVAKARCQWEGRIFKPGETIEMAEPSKEFLSQFAKVPETVTETDADTRTVAGLTREDYRRRLDGMEQRYAETATVEELAKQFMVVCSYPNIESGQVADPDAGQDADKDADKVPELDLEVEPAAEDTPKAKARSKKA